MFIVYNLYGGDGYYDRIREEVDFSIPEDSGRIMFFGSQFWGRFMEGSLNLHKKPDIA